MANKFKYDVYSLIELVKSKICLWDQTSEEYKDKIRRRNAWREVSIFFQPDFEELDRKMQDQITATIVNKWHNLRDAFMRSIKTKPGQAAKKKYVYSDYMQFLLKTIATDDTYSSIKVEQEPSQSDSSQSSTIGNSLINFSKVRHNSRKRRLNRIEEEILKAITSVPSTSNTEHIDDDHAFVLSILPSMKMIPEADKFEFRIKVMQLLSSYRKCNKNERSNSFT